MKTKAKSTITIQADNTGDLVQQCADAIRAMNRKDDIAAAVAADNNKRWVKRAKQASALLRGVKVSDYPWGAIFTGTKAALIRAGLVSVQFIPAKNKEKSFCLPLNWEDGYNAACYGTDKTPATHAIPQCWNAEIWASDFGGDPKDTFSISVEFDKKDELDTVKRTKLALDEMDRPDMNLALLRDLVARIPPTPLSVIIPEAIKAARKFPK